MINHMKRLGIPCTQTLKLTLNLPLSQKGGMVATLEKDTPQPAHALEEFVKHIADPLVDKGWNLHLKCGKGVSQGEQFIQGSSPREPTAKTDKRKS